MDAKLSKYCGVNNAEILIDCGFSSYSRTHNLSYIRIWNLQRVLRTYIQGLGYRFRRTGLPRRFAPRNDKIMLIVIANAVKQSINFALSFDYSF